MGARRSGIRPAFDGQGLRRQAQALPRAGGGRPIALAFRDRPGQRYDPRGSGEAREGSRAREPRSGVSRRPVRAGHPVSVRRARAARFDQAELGLDPATGVSTMMKNQLAGLMKQAQAMQDSMKKAQEEIARMEIEGQAGAGLVKVVMTGRHDVKRVTIDPSLLSEEKDMLEDLVAAAVNDAVRKVEAASQEKMAGLTAGLPMPPGFK